MGEKMKKGEGKKGEGKGDKEGEGEGDKAGDFAKKQEEIRKQLSDYYEQLKKEGEGGNGNMSKILKDMEESEKDLLNKQLTQELMMRQQQILNRMLDFEKSVREQGYEEKRESKTGKDYDKISPSEIKPEMLKEFIRKEHFNVSKYIYTPQYQELINEYLKSISNK